MIATELSPEVRALAACLGEVPRGGLVTLAALSEAIGRDITECRHLLYSAMNVVQRKAGAVFKCERGVGYRRMQQDEAPAKLGETARGRIRRQARRASKAIQASTAHSNDLRPEIQRRANAELSALGMLEHLARDRVVHEVAKATDRPIPVTQATKTFLAAIGAG